MRATLRGAAAALLCFVCLAAVRPPGASAQSSAAGQITGTVLPAITISGTDLRFGNMLGTQIRTVAPGSSFAGRFTLTMAPNVGVTVGYVLPTTLGAGIAIGNWTALLHTANDPGSASSLGMTSGSGSFVTSTPTGELYLWLGATLTTSGAVPGTYSAPIQLTVVYN